MQCSECQSGWKFKQTRGHDSLKRASALGLSPLTWSLGLVLLLLLSSLCRDHLADSRPLRTFNGLPRVTIVRFHGSQTMAFKRVVLQLRLSTLRFQCTASNHAIRCSIKCSSVMLSRPSQTPWSHADPNLFTIAPSRQHATASPPSKIGCFGKTCVGIFSYAVVVEFCRLWDRVYCHAARRGKQRTVDFAGDSLCSSQFKSL